MDIHTRIRERRVALGLSREELGEACGVSYQTIGKWETLEAKGGTAPKRWRVRKVAEQLKVTAEWLLTGNSDNVQSVGVIQERYAFIPRYIALGSRAVKHHAEISNINDDGDTFAYRIDWLQRNRLNPVNCKVLETRDESMMLGDQLLIDESKKTIVPGLPYLLDGPAGVRVRRLFIRFDGQITMRADNAAFPEETAPASALTIVGQVVAFQGSIGSP